MILGPDDRPYDPGPQPAHRLPRANIPFGEVRDWRKVGRSQYFHTPHPIYPWDTRAVELFREEIDPTMVPLWVRSVYRNTTGGVYVFDRHVITAYDPKRINTHPKYPVHPDLINITATSGGFHPNWIVEILGDKGGVLPGPFVAFGMLHYYRYKELTEIANHESIEDNHRNYIQGRLDKIRRMDEQAEAESNYRWDQDWGFLMRQRDKLDASDRRLVSAATDGRVH